MQLETAQLYPLYWEISRKSGIQQWPALPLAEFFATEPHSFKPYLNIAIPYVSPLTRQWEPKIQQSDNQELPLVLVQRILATMLKTLAPAAVESAKVACRVKNFPPNRLKQILQQLAAVVINHPVGASDAYRFNMREAVLAAGLVARPEQIFFVEDVVAAFLPEIYSRGGPTPSVQAFSVASDRPAPTSFTDSILVVSAGATTTDLALVKIPQPIQALNREHLWLRRIPYAGNALDQDIIYQLLDIGSGDWQGLGLQDLDRPLPGEPDLETRYRLQQRLEARALGQSLLKAIRVVKPRLCQGDVSLQVGDRDYPLRHQDLQNWVISPYVQQLGRELAVLLHQAKSEISSIQTVICAGGTASIPAIAHWLQQKFPQAEIVQDTLPNASAATMHHARIAQGLALLPCFSGLLDSTRHQYSEFFLLRQMLKTLANYPNHLLSSGRILQLLERGGMSPAFCQPIILGFLEGQLPIGLVPSRAIAAILTPESRQNQDYQSLLSTPLFLPQGNQIYRLNSKQRYHLWRHLQSILANTRQTLDAPLAIGFRVGKT